MLLDIHTHRISPIPGESIRNVDAVSFSPVEGFYYSAGMHPWNVTDGWEKEWDRLVEVVCHPSVLAVGEAGLDKLSPVGLTLQKAVFERQILLSEEVGKPLVIHCVKAFNELVGLKKKYRPTMPWVVHGFRNNPNIARQLVHEGIYFSLGEKFQDEVLREMPAEHLLTETDESRMDIREIIARIAVKRGMQVAELLSQIDVNARRIFFGR